MVCGLLLGSLVWVLSWNEKKSKFVLVRKEGFYKVVLQNVEEASFDYNTMTTMQNSSYQTQIWQTASKKHWKACKRRCARNKQIAHGENTGKHRTTRYWPCLERMVEPIERVSSPPKLNNPIYAAYVKANTWHRLTMFSLMKSCLIKVCSLSFSDAT